MAQVTAYSALWPLMIGKLPGIGSRTQLLTQALNDTVRDFCRETEAWHEELWPLALTNLKRECDLSAGHNYSAFIHRIKSVKVNAAAYDKSAYDLIDEQWLRFSNDYAPNDLTSQLLVCGTAGLLTALLWSAITDGSATFSVGGSTYGVTDLDFSACTTMDAVARVIEDAVRVAMDTPLFYAQWDEKATRFLFWTDAQEASYLTAGTEGTDISGSGHLNGLTGGTGVALAPWLVAEVVFRPHILTDAIPDWLLDRWAEHLIAGALWRLQGQDGAQWANPNESERNRHRYRAGIVKAKVDNVKRYKGEIPGLLS